MLGIQHIWVQYIQCIIQVCIVFIKSRFLAVAILDIFFFFLEIMIYLYATHI